MKRVQPFKPSSLCKVYSIFPFLLTQILLLLFRGVQEFVKRGDHGRDLGFRCLDMKLEAGILDGLGGIAAESADERAVLFVPGEIIQQALHPAGREEADHVKTMGFQFGHVIADRPVHEGCLEFAFVVLEPVHDLVILLVL